MTLLLLVLLRGAWGLWNLGNRPARSGLMRQTAAFGHSALYALMVIAPAVRPIAALGGVRGPSYLVLPVFPVRDAAIAWTRGATE